MHLRLTSSHTLSSPILLKSPAVCLLSEYVNRVGSTCSCLPTRDRNRASQSPSYVEFRRSPRSITRSTTPKNHDTLQLSSTTYMYLTSPNSPNLHPHGHDQTNTNRHHPPSHYYTRIFPPPPSMAKL
ncbi:hypothetical protein M440DRAFT_1173832 [Trichoderma longibrachiatum ATCC 18648]|uniref:Uncharacterized protein n=1 Tax=Trichoderma longibrachiatum ATCC 18648 TaxID=983965 RepID=A0A2T4CDJ0_TRILO|nr:hypothetical protein M440DRAFT_1173832 [Trichoderma longibrachiatum ATCC 18648]